LCLAYRSNWRQVVFLTSNVAVLVKGKASISPFGRLMVPCEMMTGTKLRRKIKVTQRGERGVKER
jgi:hypothetical protein